jgi:hypothetical protein
VTPADVHCGRQEAKRRQVEEYRKAECSRRDVPPWTRKYWDVLKSAVDAAQMTSGELLTKLAFFCLSPLRRIARRNREFAGGNPAAIPQE